MDVGWSNTTDAHQSIEKEWEELFEMSCFQSECGARLRMFARQAWEASMTSSSRIGQTDDMSLPGQEFDQILSWSLYWLESADVCRIARSLQRQAFPKTRITVHVVSARDLKSLQFLDKLDPFCRVQHQNQVFDTQVFVCLSVTVLVLVRVFMHVCVLTRRYLCV